MFDLQCTSNNLKFSEFLKDKKNLAGFLRYVSWQVKRKGRKLDNTFKVYGHLARVGLKDNFVLLDNLIPKNSDLNYLPESIKDLFPNWNVYSRSIGFNGSQIIIDTSPAMIYDAPFWGAIGYSKFKESSNDFNKGEPMKTETKATLNPADLRSIYDNMVKKEEEIAKQIMALVEENNNRRIKIGKLEVAMARLSEIGLI